MATNKTDEFELFESAMELPIEERDGFLDRVCDDAAVRARISSLLRASELAGDFLEAPAAPDLVASDPDRADLYHADLDHADLDHADHVLKAIGPYKLIEPIAEGGMGVVYMAEQQWPVRRMVALKIIKPGMDSKQVIARFEAERQALAMMDHPNIARVFDAGTTETGHPFFVMELVRGVPITNFCDEQRLSTEQRLGLMGDVCRAVQHAHQKGIIHRDLKPSNVLVELHDVTPVVKVIDFGVAKAIDQQLTDKTLHTGFLQMVGTPTYMSPEQAQHSGLDVDTRSDVYSLGVLLYELLTRETPFDRDLLHKVGYEEARKMICEQDPARPSDRISTLGIKRLSTLAECRRIDPRKLAASTRGELDWIVMKALEKDRRRRYASASDLADDIDRYLRREPVEAGPPSILYRSSKFIQRNKAAALTAGLIVITMALATGVSMHQASKARAARRLADQRLDLATEGLAREQKARAEADSLRQQERARARELRNLLYSSDFLLASQAMNEGDVRTSGQILRRLEPIVDEVDIRGPEWNWVYRETFPPRREVKAHDGEAYAVRYSPNGDRLVSCGKDGVIQVFKADTLERIHQIKTSHGAIRDMAFLDSEGTRLAAGGDDGVISVWNLATASHDFSFQAHPSRIRHMVYSPHHECLVTCAAERSVRFWSVGTDQATEKRGFEPHNGTVASLAVSNDGKWLFTAASEIDQIATVWEWNSLDAYKRLAAATRFPSVAFSADGQWLGLGSLEQVTYLRNLGTWDPPAGLIRKDGVECITFSRDGAWGADGDRGGSVGIWPMLEGVRGNPWEGGPTLPRSWMAHEGRVWSVCFSPDGSELATCGQDGMLKVWPVEQCTRASQWQLTDFNGPVADFAFLSNDALATLTGNSISVIDPTNARTLRRQDISGPLRTSLAVTPDGQALIIGDDKGGIELRSVDTLEATSSFRDESVGGIDSIGFEPENQWIFAAGIDLNLTLSYPDLKPIPGIPQDWCNAIAVSSSGGLFARAIAEKNVIEVWKCRPLKRLATFSGYRDAIHCLAFSPDNRLLASGDGERLIRIWDLETKSEVRRLSGHLARIECLQFASDGRSLFSLSRNYRIVRIWNLETGRELAEIGPGEIHRQPWRRLALSPNGQLLAYLHDHAVIRLLDFAPFEP